MSLEPGSTCPPRKPPYVVLGTPRSRTRWLSSFLTYSDWACGHDEMIHARTLDDIKAWLSQPNTGTVETMGAPWWRTLRQLRPDASIVVVRRPVDEVVDSLRRAGVPDPHGVLPRAMKRLDQKLDQIEHRVPGVLSVTFASLADEGVCAKVFEHCLPYAHDHAWWAHLSQKNIQINMPALLRYYEAHRPQLDKLAQQAKWVSIQSFTDRPTRDLDDGVVIQEEAFDRFWDDSSTWAFPNHLVATDQHPAEWLNKNSDLMRALDKIGALHVVTARCNGRVFGYLMTIISPSLDARDVTSGIPTLFYAAPEFPGLGMRMQRFTRDALKARGVTEMFYRAGTRGSGPKLGTLYRRLGAVPAGNVYHLNLNGT